MTPERKLMLVVRELHLMGYEGLRLAPYLAPSGCYWRAQIVPIEYISDEHGAIVNSIGLEIPSYSSATKFNYFDLNTTEADTPQQIAEKFIFTYASLCTLGKITDAEYVQWYLEMLSATDPNGVIYAFADFDVPLDRMAVARCAVNVFVPLPPLPKRPKR